MGIIIDIAVIIFLILGIISGIKRGLIKSLVGLIGLIATIIIAWRLKTPIANFLIDKMPFYQFNGLPSLSILVFNILSFVVVFIILYCILSIILTLTKFVDTLLKLTVIWIVPSKIGGAIIGFIEAWVYLNLLLFVLFQFNVSAAFINQSTVGKFVLNNTPVINRVLGDAIVGAREIYEEVDKLGKDTTKTSQDVNLYILQVEINHRLITKEKAQELIETGKVGLENVLIG